MYFSISPTLVWSYWANTLYIIGMIGYLLLDTINYLHMRLNNKILFTINLSLAILFIIDAMLYAIDWYMYAVKFRDSKNKPIEYISELVACIFQTLGSCFYLIGAVLIYEKIRFMEMILLSYFIGIVAHFFESILTFVGWFVRIKSKKLHKSISIRNITLWAHLLNIIANVIYSMAIILAFYFYKTGLLVDSSTSLLIQVLGDFIYLFDAGLYQKCWYLEKNEWDSISEQNPLKKFHSEKDDRNKNKNKENS